MTKEARAKEVILAIVKLVNEGKKVTFEEDWGGNSLTVFVDGSHSHVGMPDFTNDQLIDSLHDLLCKNTGLSFVPPIQPLS